MSLSAVASMQELHTIMIFGIGSLFLYIVVPVALFANEVRLAKQSDDTSGTAAIFNSIVQAFFYIVAWSVFVSIIVFLVIKFGHKDATNPAVGIYRYWDIDWFANGNLSSNFKGTQITQAKLIVLIITWAKAVELLLLGVFFALALKLSMSLPLLKMRRADHYKMTSQIDVGTMMSIFMTGIVGWVIFMAILSFENIMIKSLLKEGHDLVNAETKSLIPIISEDKNIVTNDFQKLLKMGIAKIKD